MEEIKPVTIEAINSHLGEIRLDHCSPVRVYGSEKLRREMGETTLVQACNMRLCPGVEGVVLTPDAHQGFGAPIGCVMATPSHIYPGPVGVDIDCSMSLLQFDLPAEVIAEKPLRRALINAITKRIPTGYKRSSTSSKYSDRLIETALIQGATENICDDLGVPKEWICRCEDTAHLGHDGTSDALALRIEHIKNNIAHAKGSVWNFHDKIQQLGSYGGGNHFGECEIVRLAESEKNAFSTVSPLSVAQTFGLVDGNVAFLSHCGSRGFGAELARSQFKLLKEKFEKWGIPFPSGDPQLIYAPIGTPEADDYLDDMALAANFSTLNHLVINSLIVDAFQEIIPGVRASLIYHISHNMARKEIIDGRPLWIHRKGATRAYPANHFSLVGTPFERVGHPILLPGNPCGGSAVMTALEGAKNSYYSINHGAGRAMGRKKAMQELVQYEVDKALDEADILYNSRNYPLDEAPSAYKNFEEVLRSVESAGLARCVARLHAKFVIKDSYSKPDD